MRVIVETAEGPAQKIENVKIVRTQGDFLFVRTVDADGLSTEHNFRLDRVVRFVKAEEATDLVE